MSRVRRLLATLGVAVVAALGVACAGAPDDGASHEAAGLTWRGTVVDEATAKPDITLTGTDGQPYELRAETDGKLTLLFFGYTHCPDACPLQMATVAGSLSRMSGEIKTDTEVVFVTTDPARDTPQRLDAWLGTFNDRFVGLTGTPEQVAAAQEAAGVALAGVEAADDDGRYLVGHATQILVYTPDGRGHVVYPAGVRQADWDHDLPQLFRVPEWQVAP